MFELRTVQKIKVKVSGGQETHPTAGYRKWAGRAASSEPIVAFAIIETENQYSWVRSSNREDTLEMGILFSPMDETFTNLSVSFSVGDSVVCDKCIVPSKLTEPNPKPGIFNTGIAYRFAELLTRNKTELHILFLLKSDVKFLKKGIWHLRASHIEQLSTEWKNAFTYGRTGIIKKC